MRLRKKVKHPACQDCKHMDAGFTTKTHYYKQNVCLLKPKRNGCYYAADFWKPACDKYEPKEGGEK